MFAVAANTMPLASRELHKRGRSLHRKYIWQTQISRLGNIKTHIELCARTWERCVYIASDIDIVAG